MKKSTITLSYNSEKLLAIEQYMEKKNARLGAEMDDYLQRLYEKYVPPLVREYIESRDRNETPAQPRVPRPKTADSDNGAHIREDTNG